MSFFLADVVSQNCLVLKAKQEFIHLTIAIPTYRKGSSFKIYYNVCNLLYHEKGTYVTESVKSHLQCITNAWLNQSTTICK